MPALAIYRKFDTSPFAGDDLHIICLISGMFRFIQLVCIVPLNIHLWWETLNGAYVQVNGYAPWCDGYPGFEFNLNSTALLHDQKIESVPQRYYAMYLSFVVVYFCVDVAWMCCLWTATSIGTPTEPRRRNIFVRQLIITKIFPLSLFPFCLFITGILRVHIERRDHYGCPEGVNFETGHDPWHGHIYNIFIVLMCTYAFEVLLWPLVIINFVVRKLKKNRYFDKREEVERSAERLERILGFVLRLIQCCTCGKFGGQELTNKGELSEFALNIMHLFNNDTKLNIVLSDMYCGFLMLSRAQRERRCRELKRALRQVPPRRRLDNMINKNDGGMCLKRGSLIIVQCQDSGSDNGELIEREILQESNSADKAAMKEIAHYVTYASCIYFRLQNMVINDFMAGETITSFVKEDLFKMDFRLSNIGYEHALLCYANFVNGIVATPYAILIDEKTKKVVIVIRGTRSVEDIVVDLLFVPATLDKVGLTCGFKGDGHFCHKGVLARSKWLYNDIHKAKVLKRLYSDESPFKDYDLVCVGHSLGAGCASVLGIMLRPTFPSLRCYAYCPPGGLLDEDMSAKCEDFITSVVRHDDIIPRLSFHSFERVRDAFLATLERFKVSKIKLFFHLRRSSQSLSNENVAVYNAEVLKPRDDINTDTEFHKQLETYRDERESKTRAGVNGVNLYIAGKIVHILDMNGNGKYLPYWGGRKLFTQITLSPRMLSDHDIHGLVDILKTTCNGWSDITFQHESFVCEGDQAPPVDDIEMFVCCSNPYGFLPIILSVLATVTFALQIKAYQTCDFARLDATNEQGEYFLVSLGLFRWTLHECVDGLCKEDAECVIYPPHYAKDRSYLKLARSAGGISQIFALLSLLCLWVSTCFKVRRRIWVFVTSMSLMASFFIGVCLTFSRHCESIEYLEFTIQCAMGEGAIFTIVSCSSWFVIAVCSSSLAKGVKCTLRKTDTQSNNG